MQVERAVSIEAPAARVWAVMSDVERWPEWTASVTRVRLLNTPRLEVGSRVRIEQPWLPPAVWQVTVLEPGRSFSWVAGGPGLRSTGTHTVTAAGDGQSVATLSLVSNGLLVALLRPWLGPLTVRYVGIEAAGLKHRSEQSPGRL